MPRSIFDGVSRRGESDYFHRLLSSRVQQSMIREDVDRAT